MVKLLLIANALMVFVFLFRFNHLPPQIPLFYSRAWGEDQLADSWLLLILPFLLNFLFFFNRILINRYFKTNQFAVQIINILNLFLIITITAIFIKIIIFIT